MRAANLDGCVAFFRLLASLEDARPYLVKPLLVNCGWGTTLYQGLAKHRALQLFLTFRMLVWYWLAAVAALMLEAAKAPTLACYAAQLRALRNGGLLASFDADLSQMLLLKCDEHLLL